MIITINGTPGSGKTTLAKALAKKLGYKHYSGGDMRGQLAMERGLTIDQLNEIGKKEDWTDKEIDKKVEHFGKTQDDFVMDSRTAWHFIPNSVKIFLACDMKKAAERIFANQRPDEKHQKTVEGMLNAVIKRWKDDVERYKKWYSVDISDEKNYDFALDTTGMTIEQSVQKVLNFIKSKL